MSTPTAHQQSIAAAQPAWMPADRTNCTRRSCIAQLVEEAAAANPEAIAIASGSAQLTYRELLTRAQQIASRLRAAGAGPDIPVGLFLERSFDSIACALGVFYAGAAYLPLDPHWPAQRIEDVLTDSQTKIVIAREAQAQATWSSNRVILDPADRTHAPAPLAQAAAVRREDLAYIIYTSGSTGSPKGVEVTHGNLLNLVFWHRRAFGITAADRSSHLAGLGFDAAVWEIWPYLSCGATISLVEESTRTSPEHLRDWLVRENISVAFVPTPLAEPMLTLAWPAQLSLRFLLTGADTLHRYASAQLPFAVINNYGPTECTVVATSGAVASGEKSDASLPPIGKPIAHTQIHILDDQGQPVPPGVIGEIYIGGTSVARGYRNQPEATSERFLDDRFSHIPGARLYRTGDLGCWRPDGEIAFHGRADQQEKILGHRVEPQEIAAAIDRHPHVAACAVIAQGDPSSRHLVAYVAPHDGVQISGGALRDYLAERLPAYMVPSIFVRVASLPLNPNGKLDRAALPAPDARNTLTDGVSRAPENEIETQLTGILQTLLKMDHVSPDDNFFLLGTHSLLATQIVLRVQESFGIQLTLRDLFKAKTVARLAVEIEHRLLETLAGLSDEEVARLLAN